MNFNILDALIAIGGKHVCGSTYESLEWLDEKIPKPSEKEINDKIAELKDNYEKQSYARSRAESYDPIPEQLDQIYHDIDGWKARIKAVKDKFPKPQ